MGRYSTGWITVVVVAIVAVISIGIAAVVNDGHARSTEGVVTISDYEATISKGDTLVLTSSSGKTRNYWKVTFDGNNTVFVNQDSSFFPSNYSGPTCGVGCHKELEMGWLRHITITEKADHRVSIQWPWGWGYRRYQS